MAHFLELINLELERKTISYFVKTLLKLMPIIKIETLINANIETCFDLSRSIEFHTHSTDQTNEKAIEGRTKGLIELNETVTWEATHFFIRQRLTSKIAVFDYPNHIRDEMVKGAFQSFKHDHFFLKQNDQTLMTDVFEFESPFGWIGKWFNFFVLENYMEKFLRRRCEKIKEAAESGAWKKFIN